LSLCIFLETQEDYLLQTEAKSYINIKTTANVN